jgi:hypothetical protein
MGEITVQSDIRENPLTGDIGWIEWMEIGDQKESPDG